MNHELSVDIPQPENTYPQFGSGVRIEKQGSIVFIYDPSGKRRWEIQDFVMDWENKRHMSVELRCETAGGTWHLLMGAYQVRDAKDDAEIGTGVEIEVLKDRSGLNGNDSTDSRMMVYYSGDDGKLFKGWTGGYYGKRADIEQDFETYRALAKTQDELPGQIDIQATCREMGRVFREGRFEPPAFVLTGNKSENRFSLTSLFQKLIGGKANGIQKTSEP
jgi:hypothetical protein